MSPNFSHKDAHYSFLISDNNDRACYNNISKIYYAVFLLSFFDGTEAASNVCGVEHSSEQRDSESSGRILKAFFSFIFSLLRGRREKFLCCLIFWNINDDYRHRKKNKNE